MGWPRRESAAPAPEIEQGVTKAEFDERMQQLEDRMLELKVSKTEVETAEKKLRRSIEDAKRVNTELENSIAAAKRRGQGRW